jgi:hypothetical protein
MHFNPKGKATAIGSYPYHNPSEAVSDIMNTIPEIPVWPQLPNTDYKEQMEIQFSEGFPCIKLDEAKRAMYFEIGDDPSEKLGEFYENVVADNIEYFKISPQFSRGIYEMEKKLSNIDIAAIDYLKSQVTGPVTYGLSRTDEHKRAVYYNEIFRDVIVKGLIMKARWILKKFSRFGISQICFVDEPILSAFGSSTYVSVKRNEVVECLREVYDAIHQENAIAGTHCCGNTEWTILIDAGADIISFDAYEYGETIIYYHEKIKTFLEGGGVLAWGIVPTSEKINRETPESLIEKLLLHINKLAGKGIDRSLLWQKCLLTPSCGTGSMSGELSARVFNYLKNISNIIRQKPF